MSYDPRDTWKMHLYGATADTGAGTPYDTVLLSTISGYTGYATKAVYIVQSGQGWDVESFISADISGHQFGTNRRRRRWQVRCFPFTFAAGTTQDLEDNDDLTSILDTKTYHWVRFEAGSRAQPSTTAAYPVVVEAYTQDTGAGIHTVTLDIKHRYIV